MKSENAIGLVLCLVFACGGQTSNKNSTPLGTGGSVASAGTGGAAGLSTGGSTSAGAGANAVRWNTTNVTFPADDFAIQVAGQTYVGDAASMVIHGNPPTPTYTTLELQWTEHGQEMRLFIYFYADSTHWWSSEIRTYDGSSDWIYYYGDFFEQPLGVPYIGDLVLTNNGPSDTVRGTIIVHNLYLLPTFG